MLHSIQLRILHDELQFICIFSLEGKNANVKISIIGLGDIAKNVYLGDFFPVNPCLVVFHAIFKIWYLCRPVHSSFSSTLHV